MTLIRRFVMTGTAVALLAVGAVGCSDEGEVTAPGPGPSVEEPSEADDPKPSDGGGEEAPVDYYGVDKEDGSGLSNANHEAGVFETASKLLERINEQRANEGAGNEVADRALDVLERVKVQHAAETVRAHHVAEAVGSSVADHVQGLRNVGEDERPTFSV